MDNILKDLSSYYDNEEIIFYSLQKIKNFTCFEINNILQKEKILSNSENEINENKNYYFDFAEFNENLLVKILNIFIKENNPNISITVKIKHKKN